MFLTVVNSIYRLFKHALSEVGGTIVMCVRDVISSLHLLLDVWRNKKREWERIFVNKIEDFSAGQP
jgi:hypothetical protein